MTAAPLADAMVSAVQDAGDLVSWAQDNAVALADARLENACLAALSNPVPPELAVGIPLLKCVDPSLPTVPLLAILASYRPTAAHACDRCQVPKLCADRLLVPLGASVVAVHVCRMCRVHLDYRFPELCWD